MKTVIIIVSFFILLGCNNAETTSTPTADSIDIGLDSSAMSIPKEDEFQLRGIGIKNRGRESVIFFEVGNIGHSLAPGNTVDFRIVNSPTILMVEGQADQWEVEKHRRYQFVLMDNDKWVLEEVQ